MEKRYCKKCLIKEMDEAQYHELIEENIAFLDENDRANDEIYEMRLDVCKECDRLNSGTCLACGCYVEIRAAFRGGRCPKKKW